MSDINSEMKAAADYAIRSANEKFGQELDFSDQSLDKLDNLLDQAYKSFSNLSKDEKTSNAISRTANIWGSYLGEFIRLKYGGTWIQKGIERLVHIENIEYSPISFVYQKITDYPEYSVKKYVIEVASKIHPLPATTQFLQNQSQKNNQTKEQNYINQSKSTVTIDKTYFYILAGIGGFLLILIVCMLSYMILRTIGVSAFGFIDSTNNPNTNIPMEETMITATSYPTYTQYPSQTPYPSYTQIATYTTIPTYTPYPTYTQLVTLMPTETQRPFIPTHTQVPIPSPTNIPEIPTDTPRPPTEPPPPTLTATEARILESCEIDPSIVPFAENVPITFIVHFSPPDYPLGFDVVFDPTFMGQRGCIGTNHDNNGTAYCDGSSGMITRTTVSVTLNTSLGKCVATYRAR